MTTRSTAPTAQPSCRAVLVPQVLATVRTNRRTDRLFARIFTSTSPLHCCWSTPASHAVRDGTDPLFGGHPAGHSNRRLIGRIATASRLGDVQ